MVEVVGASELFAVSYWVAVLLVERYWFVISVEKHILFN